jgi:membrane-bound serine protease (ClpP class)
MTGHPRRRSRIARTIAVMGLLLLGVSTAVSIAAGADGGPRVQVLTATGVVDGAMASYLREGVARAADSGMAAVVVRVDTPGGDSVSMDDIKQSFLEAPLPVIVWVAPSGARAASAGTFITLAAHLAYMAPATNIGAASPIAAGGQDIPGTLGVKVKEDAMASIAALAEARGRPVEWAVSTVRDARSYTASQALAAGAIDGIAATLDDVLAAANGRTVTVRDLGTVTLALAGATAEDAPMNPVLGFLHLLSDPNIAFLLFVIGALGLATELIHPNLLTGIAGAGALILAFVGFGSLPLNLAGVVLLAAAFGLFVLETQIVSHGVLTIAGLVAFVLGASALYTPPLTPGEPVVAVAPVLLAVTTLTLAALVILIMVASLRTRRMRGPRTQMGKPVAAGTEGVVRAPLAPIGTVQLGGETWTAHTPNEHLVPRDTPVRLVAFEGLTAIVEPIDPADPAGPTPPVVSTLDPAAAIADRPIT